MSELIQSPVAPDFVQDPYRFYAAARGAGAVHFWRDYNMAAVFSHAAVAALLKDRRFGRAVPEGFGREIPSHVRAFYAVEAHSMLELDPPRHTRLRGLVLRAFTSLRIAGMADEIEALCHRLIDALPAEGCDILPSYCAQVPVIVIARLLGVPEAMAPQLLAWSNAMVGMYQAGRSHADEVAANAAAQAFSEFMRGYITARRDTPADDLITELICAEADGARLSTDEMITTCILLLNAGHEATVHTIGNGIKVLLEQSIGPALLAPDRIGGTVEEILRYDPPLHVFLRYAGCDVTLFGHEFRRGDPVALMLAAANRDGAVWDDPDRFDPTRLAKTNTSFGGGIHFCLGAPLARLEMQIALRVLWQRLPSLRLAGPAPYADVYHFHGLESLPLTY